MFTRRLLPAALLIACFAIPAVVSAQGTATDFARAEGLRDRYRGLIVGTVEQTAWIDSTYRFWYRKSTRAGGDFIVANHPLKFIHHFLFYLGMLCQQIK